MESIIGKLVFFVFGPRFYIYVTDWAFDNAEPLTFPKIEFKFEFWLVVVSLGPKLVFSYNLWNVGMRSIELWPTKF